MKKLGLMVLAVLLVGSVGAAGAGPKIPLPSNINIADSSSLPEEFRGLLGKWGGIWAPIGLDIIVIFQKIDLEGKVAQVIYGSGYFYGIFLEVMAFMILSLNTAREKLPLLPTMGS